MDLCILLKNSLIMDLFLINTQLLSSQDWSGVYYCDVLSAVWTLILTAPIHCRASIAEQVIHISKPDEDTNSEWPTG